MAKVSQNTKYVKLDDGVSFSLVRTNPKLTTNTKLMYNGKKMYMESYASSELLNRTMYKNVSVKQNGTYNKDIASFLTGSGSQAYSVYQNFSDTTISDSYDNQFETLYWCGAEYIESSFYDEEIGFVAPLYLREKLPNYFLIFRLNTPSNYNLVVGEDGKPKDSTFDFKTDILDKAVLIKTFDLREGTVLGNYIRNYIDQELFEFDKSIYVNFANAEVTYYGIDKISGVLEKRVESFENELLRSDNPVLKNDEWFTEGFERNGLIFPYIMNIEYLFNDDNFKHNGEESYDFARYIGVYCNNIEIGEFTNLNELSNFGNTADNAIYYFEDNKKNLHRYTSKIISESSESEIEFELKIDGKDVDEFDVDLISGFEEEKVTGYAEPLDIYEGFINRAQYGFEILKPLEPGDWIGIEYNGHAECYFADDTNVDNTTNIINHYDMLIGEYSDFRFSVNENGTVNDIAEALAKSINHNKKSKFEAKYSQNVVVIYAKREGKEYNGSETGGAKILVDASLLYNRKISLPISNYVRLVSGNEYPVEDISDSDLVKPAINFDKNDNISEEPSSFGDYYIDYFCGACDVDINQNMGTYKNIFKIYNDEYIFFGVNRYLKTNNGNGRRICSNMIYINSEGKIDPEYRLIIVEDAPHGKGGDIGYDISVSSTYQVEIMDLFKPKHGILSWFPVKDFDFDINYSLYGDYRAFKDECYNISKKVTYTLTHHIRDTYVNSDIRSTQENIFSGVISLAKSPFYDDYGNFFETEYGYYNEQINSDLCLLSKTAPYISKWGYYDEQKDSCENPYRLNVSKVFGVSNLSANTYLRDCEESQYTHNMPYYMTLYTPDYHKEYQYIASDDIYIAYNDKNISQNTNNISDSIKSFFDCVDYWVNTFKNTDEDKFSYFFSGKKYGKRFDRKYSRIMGGDKFHNPSTLFRGVKFEVIRQYNGVEKRSSEYNDYKFSFVYIPVMIDSIIFSNKVYFVKNDTFKFIVGIIFVNTMLGTYKHNIFNGNIDYFGKGFLYATCKNLIRPENSKRYTYNLTLTDESSDSDSLEVPNVLERIYSVVWERNYDVTNEKNEFYMWKSSNGENIFVTKTRTVESITDIIGECNGINDIENIKPIGEGYTLLGINENTGGKDEFEVLWMRYYKEYDATIYGYFNFEYCGSISCEINIPDIALNNNILIDVCDIEWEYFDKNDSSGYIVDVSNMRVASQSLQNILINMGISDSIFSIRFYNIDEKSEGHIDKTFINKTSNGVENKDGNCKINVNIYSGNIEISESKSTILELSGNNGENIENLRMDIVIVDKFDTNFESLGLKDYFSVFNQISMYNITESINNDYNVKYYSTVEDNKYKIKVIEPDCIEVEDKFESTPMEIIQKNKKIIGGVNIGKKINRDKIGIKVINRYSGFYNPIFNDILYYDDYTYTTRVGKIGDVKFELPYSNTNIDYNYNDMYGRFGIIKNIYYHKTNINRSDKILSLNKPIYPLINEYALDYRDYNIFSSSWDEGYFISQDNLDASSICEGIGSMKEGLCMFGSKYLNLPDYIFIDTFENGSVWNENMVTDIRDNTNIEIMYKEINNGTVKYHLFLEKRLKRYLIDQLFGAFSKYINKKYSFGNKGTIEDDVNEYVEKNLLKLYKVDRVYLYIKDERMQINNRKIENEYLKHMSNNNELKIKMGFPVISVGDGVMLKDSKFIMFKTNEFDRDVTYNLKHGFKESFGFAVSFRRK
jgi:hypothetical protein